jgi:hypothetical protein
MTQDSDFPQQAKQVHLGVSRFANLAKQTLGPKGRSVAISTPDGRHSHTKHGLLIADSMIPEDPWQAKGVSVIKAAAEQTFGDSASMIAVLTQSMLDNSDRAAKRHVNLGELKHGIDEAIRTVLPEIGKLAHNVSSVDQIVNLGTTLADGDADVGAIVGQVFTENPYVIIVDDSLGSPLTIDYDPKFHFHGLRTRPGRLLEMHQRSYLTLDRPDDGNIVIKVGGETEVDRSERAWRVKNALQATLAALKYGFVPGGGAALLHASKALAGIHGRSAAHRQGVDIVRAALREPLRQIVENAGVDGAKVVNSLMRRKDTQFGYDVQAKHYADMVGAGIIDPLAAWTKAVEGAGSIASAIVGAGSTSMEVENPYVRYLWPGPARSEGLSTEATTSPRSAVTEVPDKLNAALQGAIAESLREAAQESRGSAKPTGVGKPTAAAKRIDGGQAASLQRETAPPAETRFLVGELAERFVVGQSSILNVFVSPREGQHSAPLPLMSKGGFDIEIFVEADGFELLGPARATLSVPERGESGIVGFMLKAMEAPSHTIRISALAAGATISGLSFDVRVDGSTDEPPTPRSENSKIDTTGREDGGVALILQQDPNTKKYSFTWQDEYGTREPVYQDRSFQELNDFIATEINDIQEVVREKYELTPKLARQKLRAAGIHWWQQLIPPQISDWYIQGHDKIKRMSIISAADPIPWEALYPFRPEPKFDKGFLVEQVKISRWRFGPSAPSAISVSRADFVFPNDALESAATEVQHVIDLLQTCYELKGERIDNQTSLFDLFINASASLLHFACHNSFEKGGSIAVRPSAIKPKDFVEYEGQLKTVEPLIFVNACRTNGLDVQYTGLGGWAKTFLGIGAGAFIGTHWEVRDKSAQRFAETLYRALVKEHKCFGEAFDCAREAIKNDGDPTWLAYTFYGNHRALVKKGASPPAATAKLKPATEVKPS